MARKSRTLTFDQILAALRSHSCEVAPSSSVAGGMLVSKNGAAAILVPGEGGAGAAFAESPGVLVKGEVARLLDRGYQKFFKSEQFEVPASAAQLHAIHTFSEELRLHCGAISLYNEGLGTTSDLYQYDRLKGREADQPAAARPWELTAGH